MPENVHVLVLSVKEDSMTECLCLWVHAVTVIALV